MRLVVLASDEQKKELLLEGVKEDCTIEWFNSVEKFPAGTNADAVFDLLFEGNGYTISHLKNTSIKLIFVNSVCKTIREIGLRVIRINAWPGFLKRNLAELSCTDEALKAQAENILTSLNKSVEWVPDVKGFVSSRVISMVINEAYFALEENVSSKDEIDIAMKLGTNYPYGPFEWAKMIGLKNIVTLLLELSKEEKRYDPATLLLKEAQEQ